MVSTNLEIYTYGYPLLSQELCHDLMEAVNPYCEYNAIASYDEANAIVYVKGQYQDIVEAFLAESGF